MQNLKLVLSGLVSNKGMKNKDLKLAESIIEENEDLIIKRCKEYFKKQ